MKDKARAIALWRREEKILKKARELKRIQSNLDELKELLKVNSESLKTEVKDYGKLREKEQRAIWKERCLGWCQNCKSFRAKENIRLLYTEGLEENDRFVRRIRSFCVDCAIIILNQERCGIDLFQCYEVRKKGSVFFILKNDRWQEVNHLEKVIVEIEKKDILNKEFNVGKSFEFLDYPKLVLKVDGEDIFAKPTVAEASGAKPVCAKSCGEASPPSHEASDGKEEK